MSSDLGSDRSPKPVSGVRFVGSSQRAPLNGGQPVLKTGVVVSSPRGSIPPPSSAARSTSGEVACLSSRPDGSDTRTRYSMGYNTCMPYKDVTQRRAYGRDWMRRRREEFFSGKACVSCGATDDLELDHVDSSKKVSHSVWSWSEDRRNAELLKCQVLCRNCHLSKTAKSVEGPFDYPASVVAEIRRMRLTDGLTYREIGRRLGMSFQHANKIMNGKLKFNRE